jgi:hypothetical protein
MLSLTIGRFEGDKKEITVLLTDDGDQIIFAKKLLRRGTKDGEILSFSIGRDQEATKKVAEETRKVQEDLQKTDTGGDIKL